MMATPWDLKRCITIWQGWCIIAVISSIHYGIHLSLAVSRMERSISEQYVLFLSSFSHVPSFSFTQATLLSYWYNVRLAWLVYTMRMTMLQLDLVITWLGQFSATNGMRTWLMKRVWNCWRNACVCFCTVIDQLSTNFRYGCSAMKFDLGTLLLIRLCYI